MSTVSSTSGAAYRYRDVFTVFGKLPSIQVTAGDFTPANTQMLLQILRRLRQREAAKIIG
ncbi:hypothetical protein FS594_26175 (plasmid) [Rahnella aquatilis]|uniref:Uncharacterized protein n=1 Tax=Rahnella perminowiae TaxID=2816244 RepID=A0ABS6KVS8_9GAMM|nr:hypothetical protein [Rahnella perminowiae]MBU9833721.1 hypothetical protein [Rahnella perminowiae]UJD92634.1 hypothetical protein FS594_26175 [Rahnella aquatilis]